MIVVRRVTVFVYAALKQDADKWAAEQGIRRRDRITFGNLPRRFEGIRFSSADRIVILG